METLKHLTLEGITIPKWVSLEPQFLEKLRQSATTFLQKKVNKELGISEVATQHGKWARVAERLEKEHPITPEIDQILQKGITEFRDGFAIGAIDIDSKEK
jgi:hypothetical protein